jgi:predicted DNA-binding protein
MKITLAINNILPYCVRMDNGRLEFRISKQLKKQITQKSKRIGLTPSLVIRLLISDWLANDRELSIAKPSTERTAI